MNQLSEKERAEQYIANLGEAVAACSGALTETTRSGTIGRLEAERLQVARVLLMLVLEQLRKREGLPGMAPKWFEALPLRGEMKATPALFIRARPIGERR